MANGANIESKAKGLLGLLNVTSSLNKTTKVLNEWLDVMSNIVKPFSQVQDSAIELAKAIGMSTKGVMGTAARMVEFNREMQLSMSYNMSSEEMIRMQGALAKSLGRNVQIAIEKSAIISATSPSPKTLDAATRFSSSESNSVFTISPFAFL